MEILPLIILIISFLGLILIGTPIAWSIAISSFLTILISIPFLPASTTIAQRITSGLDNFSLLAIPLFILSGDIMNRGGIAKNLIDLAKCIIGSIPGGIAIINIVSAMLMGSIAGSAMASVSAVGSILGPEMEQEGYPKEFGVAVNITASTTGLIIPPSNILIVYSLASGGTSIAALFLAGYIPGILTGLSLMIVAYFWAVKKGFRGRLEISKGNFFKIFVKALPSLGLLFVVIGGIIGGVFTATEASVIAVIYSLFLGFLNGKINLIEIPKLFLKSSLTSSTIMLLVGASISMSWVMGYENVPALIEGLFQGVNHNPILTLLIINIILLVIGIFMDMTPAVLVFTPIFLPIVIDQGVDPVHFGIIMILNLCIGLCTPPVGSILFVGVSVANTKIEKVIKPLIPFFFVMIISLVLITMFPIFSLWLPSIFELN